MLQEKGPLMDLSKHLHVSNLNCPFQALHNPSHTSGTQVHCDYFSVIG